MKTLSRLILALFSFLLFPLNSLAEAFVINSFDAEIQIREEGSVLVRENINTTFSEQRHGIYRDIDSEGINIEVLGVEKPDGKPWPYEETRFSEGVRLRIGDANRTISGAQGYNIEYRVGKGIRFFADHDEFYWNVTGNGWDTPINEATATVQLPQSVRNSDALEFKCFTGAFQSTTSDCSFDYDTEKNQVTFTTAGVLENWEGLTIVVGLPAGSVSRPATLEVDGIPAEANVYLDGRMFCKTPCLRDDLDTGSHEVGISRFGYSQFTPETISLNDGASTFVSYQLHQTWWFRLLMFLAGLLFLAIIAEPIVTFIKYGKDPEGRGSIPPEYEAPDELRPAELGTLVDEEVHMRDISASLIDLCVRGYLAIKVLPDSRGLIFKKDDYEIIHKNEPKPGDPGLSSFEEELIQFTVGSHKTVKLSTLENSFYVHLPKLKKELYETMVKKGYFHKSPSTVRSIWTVKGSAFFVLGIFAILAGFYTVGIVFGIPLLINGILSLMLAPFMPKKTQKGRLTYEKILGFKDYLETAEKDRLKFQEKNEIFFQFLPYAMTMKVADKWSKAFEGLHDHPPDWYQGVSGGQFDAPSFVSSLNTLSTAVTSTFRSQPSSSGSSGSGFSGGFSGGGGGGGGGGSW